MYLLILPKLPLPTKIIICCTSPSTDFYIFSAPVSMNFMTSNVSSKVDIKSVKTMPDITNNTLSKSLINDKIKGIL